MVGAQYRLLCMAAVRTAQGVTSGGFKDASPAYLYHTTMEECVASHPPPSSAPPPASATLAEGAAPEPCPEPVSKVDEETAHAKRIKLAHAAITNGGFKTHEALLATGRDVPVFACKSCRHTIVEQHHAVVHGAGCRYVYATDFAWLKPADRHTLFNQQVRWCSQCVPPRMLADACAHAVVWRLERPRAAAS